jgi:hypothetical protein
MPEFHNTFSLQVIGKKRIECSAGFRATSYGLKVPFALLGDEGYPMLPYLMRPYSARNLDDKKCV